MFREDFMSVSVEELLERTESWVKGNSNLIEKWDSGKSSFLTLKKGNIKVEYYSSHYRTTLHNPEPSNYEVFEISYNSRVVFSSIDSDKHKELCKSVIEALKKAYNNAESARVNGLIKNTMSEMCREPVGNSFYEWEGKLLSPEELFTLSKLDRKSQNRNSFIMVSVVLLVIASLTMLHFIS